MQVIFLLGRALTIIVRTQAGPGIDLSNYCYCKKQKIFSENKKDLGMACHTPPLKKVRKQGEMPLPSLGPIPLR